MAVLTFVSDSLLGEWTPRPQQQTEKQAARQAHRGNPGIRAYNRHAPSAQSFICWRAEPQGGSDREGWRDGDLSGSNTPPHHHHHHQERKEVCPKIYSGKSITWLNARRGRWWWWRGMFPSLDGTWGTANVNGMVCPFTWNKLDVLNKQVS